MVIAALRLPMEKMTDHDFVNDFGPAMRPYSVCIRCPSRIAAQIRSGAAGLSTGGMRWARNRASTIAFMTAGAEPMAPASPAPFTPNGLVLHLTLRVSNVKDGTSPARGN